MSRSKVKADANADHKTNQKNPDHSAWQKVNDNRSNQGNPNHPAYWLSRSLPRPVTKK